MKNFNGRVAVITGAASGIGRALAEQLAQKGVVLVLADKNLAGLEATANKLKAANGMCSTHELDVSDAKAFEALAEEVMKTYGRVDMVFNNAGVSMLDSASEQSLEDFQWLMNINFWGGVHGTMAFLPYLKQSEEAHIINVSSVFGLFSIPLQSAYNASKFAVRGYTEALRIELAGTPVKVSCVHPGGIKTDIARSAKVTQSHTGVAKDDFAKDFEKLARTSAEQAARVILKGVEKNKKRILIGLDARVFDIVARLFPASYETVTGIERRVKAKYLGVQAARQNGS